MPIAMHTCVVQLDDAGGTPIDISAQTNAVKITYKRSVSVFHTLGSLWNDATDGGIETEIVLTLLETPTSGEAHQLARDWLPLGGARTLRIDTPSSAVGSLRYQGEVRLVSLSPAHESGAGSGSPSLASLVLTGSGDWSPAVIA
jgi:hypothetical protein